MDERATGIVLKTQLFSESSLIVRWLTADQGRIDTVARGARRPRSPFRGKLDLFFSAQFSFARSRSSDLHNLREIRLLDTFTPLRTDLSRLRQAAYTSALLAQTTETGTPMPELFDLFAGFLRHLVRHPPDPLLPLAFELKLLAALGQLPDLPELQLSPRARQIAEMCVVRDWTGLVQQRSAEAPRTELSAALQRFLLFQFGRLPGSRPNALQVPT